MDFEGEEQHKPCFNAESEIWSQKHGIRISILFWKIIVGLSL